MPWLGRSITCSASPFLSPDMAQTSSSNARRVQRRRDKLRSQGMRPLQIWVPDTRAPGFAKEAARQARLIAETTTEEELNFLDRLADDVLREG